MKILIGYDGSRSAEAALDDLQRAGLPDEGEFLVLSVAEIWMPPPQQNKDFQAYAEDLQAVFPEKGGKILAEAETFAHHAEKRLRLKFPNWKIRAETNFGSPAREILKKAETFNPDLIAVGSEGRSAIGRVLLGSVSRKILTEAKCSARAARGKIEVDPSPLRVVIGFDGSKGAKAAVSQVASRNWREMSEIRLIAATNHSLPAAIGRFVPPVAEWVDDEARAEQSWIEMIAAEELEKLRSASLSAELLVYPGNPKKVLIEEAQKWNADCIFLGATADSSRVERFLLGSTAAAIAERAHCSVEVVRK